MGCDPRNQEYKGILGFDQKAVVRAGGTKYSGDETGEGTDYIYK